MESTTKQQQKNLTRKMNLSRKNLAIKKINAKQMAAMICQGLVVRPPLHVQINSIGVLETSISIFRCRDQCNQTKCQNFYPWFSSILICPKPAMEEQKQEETQFFLCPFRRFERESESRSGIRAPDCIFFFFFLTKIYNLIVRARVFLSTYTFECEVQNCANLNSLEFGTSLI